MKVNYAACLFSPTSLKSESPSRPSFLSTTTFFCPLLSGIHTHSVTVVFKNRPATHYFCCQLRVSDTPWGSGVSSADLTLGDLSTRPSEEKYTVVCVWNERVILYTVRSVLLYCWFVWGNTIKSIRLRTSVVMYGLSLDASIDGSILIIFRFHFRLESSRQQHIFRLIYRELFARALVSNKCIIIEIR